ncbi:hypothetical protein [Planctomicrobium piriforme]|uniref:Uncharacterized protein n=1 Tax=Planctomicrobium piriforme TaxID=1576369 RepID=A0A1I3DKY9_9PLAN|nr:hypothetical protein [Planctomicrobium piriforme]SFH87366.1 hypothetical protein SAMN05421753_103302 [Planctomicrobium piriforme]
MEQDQNPTARPKFQLGDRVQIDQSWFVELVRGAIGRIASPPLGLNEYRGHYRIAFPYMPTDAPGEIVYWVEFDDPVHEPGTQIDTDAAEVSQACLSLISH